VIETIVLRTLAVLSMLMGSTLAVRAVVIATAGDPAENWKRLVARLALALALLYVGRLAWLRPRGRAQRFRRKALRLVAFLARPELQREHAESAPSVSLAEALLADWAAMRGQLEAPELRDAFAADERADLATLDVVVSRMAPGVPDRAGSADELAVLASDPAWQAIRAAAAGTLERFAARAGAAHQG